MCVCVWERESVCVCVRVSERERERERKRERDREKVCIVYAILAHSPRYTHAYAMCTGRHARTTHAALALAQTFEHSGL